MLLLHEGPIDWHVTESIERGNTRLSLDLIHYHNLLIRVMCSTVVLLSGACHVSSQLQPWLLLVVLNVGVLNMMLSSFTLTNVAFSLQSNRTMSQIFLFSFSLSRTRCSSSRSRSVISRRTWPTTGRPFRTRPATASWLPSEKQSYSSVRNSFSSEDFVIRT